MMHHVQRRDRCSPVLAFFVSATLLFGCSESGGPSGLDFEAPPAGMARLTGQLTAGPDASASAGHGLVMADGGTALDGVEVTILDGAGNEILTTTTDLEGEFEGIVPPGTYTVILAIDPETQFTFSLDIPEGTTFFVSGEVNINPSGKFTLNAEITRIREDGSEDTFTIRITGRLAGEPQSGDVDVEGQGDKVAVCHFPPGNPENFHTIFVGPDAVADHLAHGDTDGACEDDSTPEDTDPVDEQGGDGEKAAICHIPPGSPENARTLHIDPDDVQDHLDHGDTEGECPEEGAEESAQAEG